MLISSQLFRDPSAWHQLTVSYDAAASAPALRLRVYLDGSEITSWSTDNRSSISTSDAVKVNTSVTHYIGAYGTQGYYFDGYLADVYLIDGQALSPTSFGGYDSNGFWKPKAYAGAYGTDGFHLDFSQTGYTDFGTSGSIQVGPLQQTTTYTLQCVPDDAPTTHVSAQATVTVVNGAGLNLTLCDPTDTFCSVNGGPGIFMTPNTNAYISWSSTGVDAGSCSVVDNLTPQNTIGIADNQATTTTLVTQNTTYTLQCASGSSTLQTTASVSVNQTCQTGTGTAPLSCSSQCVFDTSTLTPDSAGATLSWCCPSGPSAGTNFTTGGAVTGSKDVIPSSQTTYTLSCPTGQGSVTLTPQVAQPPSSSDMTFSATRVHSGNPSTLSWSVLNMAQGISCLIAPAPAGSQPSWDGTANPFTGSTLTTSIFAPTQYTLTCGNGTASSSVSVVVPLVPTVKEI